MYVNLNCEWDEKTGTLLIRAPAEILDGCKRISISHGIVATLFTECGYAFGMGKCVKEDSE